MSTTFNDGVPASGSAPPYDSGPTQSPVTLAEIKAHLRVDGDDEDDLIQAYNLAAAAGVEEYCNRVMMRRTFTLTLDDFPGYRRPIRLPRVPAAAVTAIEYTRDDGTAVTVSSALYRFVSGSPRVFAEVEPVDGECWPDDVIDQAGSVRITYTAGYAADGDDPALVVPSPMRMAVRQWAASMHRLRETVVVGAAVAEIPDSLRLLLSTYRTITV